MAKQILVADDSVTMQRVVAMTLGALGHQLVFVDNGDDAVRKAAEIKPDLIIADAVMPRRSGYDVATAIRADGRLAATPVLLLVPTSEPYDAARGQTAGVSDTIVKPFETKSFIEKVARLTGGAPLVAASKATMPGPAAFAVRPVASPPAAPASSSTSVPAFATPSTSRPAAATGGFAQPKVPSVGDPFAVSRAPKSPVAALPRDPFAPVPAQSSAGAAALFPPKSAAPAPIVSTPRASTQTPATSVPPIVASRDPFSARGAASSLAPSPAPKPPAPPPPARDPFAFAKAAAPRVAAPPSPAGAIPAAPVSPAQATPRPVPSDLAREHGDTWGEMTPPPRATDHDVASPASFKHAPELTPTPIAAARPALRTATRSPSVQAPSVSLPPEPSSAPLSELDLWGESTHADAPVSKSDQSALWDGGLAPTRAGVTPSTERGSSSLPADATPFDELWPVTDVGSVTRVAEFPSPAAALRETPAPSAAPIGRPDDDVPMELEIEPLSVEAAPLLPPSAPRVAAVESTKREVSTPPVVSRPSADVVETSVREVGILDEAMLDALASKIVAKLSTAVVERVAWEVVPALAETVIREELHRVIRGKES